MKEIAGRGKNASFNFRTGPNPCAYRLYILISSSGLGIGNTKARVFERGMRGPLLRFPSYLDPVVCALAHLDANAQGLPWS